MRHCLTPQSGQFRQQGKTNCPQTMDREGCLGYSTHRVPTPTTQLWVLRAPKHPSLQDSLQRRWWFRCHFTSKLSHGAVEYLPRDLWANSVGSQIQLLCPRRHSLGLGPVSGSMQNALASHLSQQIPPQLRTPAQQMALDICKGPAARTDSSFLEGNLPLVKLCS